MTDFRAVIRLFSGAGVECVIVGGLAATIHGSARLTQDVDLVYARTGANIDRLVDALRPHAPYLRGAPPGLLFEWSRATVERGLDFTLATSTCSARFPAGGTTRLFCPTAWTSSSSAADADAWTFRP